MNWNESNGGFVTAFVECGESVEQAMSDVCRRIWDHVIPDNAGVSWDCLRVEIWPDSGRLIAFPSSTSTPLRIEKAGCQVIFGDLLAWYEELADSELTDEEFVVALQREETMWIEKFLVAAREVGLAGHRVQFWEADGDRPIHEEML